VSRAERIAASPASTLPVAARNRALMLSAANPVRSTSRVSSPMPTPAIRPRRRLRSDPKPRVSRRARAVSRL
jgi:hypothetical protein